MNHCNLKAAARTLPHNWRLLIIVLTLEFAALVSNSADLIPRSNSYTTRLVFGALVIACLSYFAVFIAAGLDYIYHRAQIILRDKHLDRKMPVIQLFLFVICLITINAFPTQGPQGVIDTTYDVSKRIIYGLLTLELIVFFSATALWLAPKAYWAVLIKRYKARLILAAIFVIAVIMSRVLYFDPDKILYELLLSPTLYLAHNVGTFLGLDLVEGTKTSIFGTPHFKVSVGSECAGYQGSFILTSVLTGYIWYYRAELIMPRVILTALLGVLSLFILNAVRIALLVAVGHYWSPTVAINGFHSVAGLLMLLLVFSVALYGLNEVQWLRKIKLGPLKQKASSEISETLFWATPLLVEIAVSLATTALSGSFYWAYPVHIMFVAVYMWVYRQRLPTLRFSDQITSPVVGGIAVFALWIYLIPSDPQASRLFEHELLSAPIYITAVWLIFRVIGSSIIVPIVEELAFRSFAWAYVDEKIGRQYSDQTKLLIKLTLSSTAFALLHSAFIASFLASLAYGVIFQRRKHLSDAVLAHAVTNLLIALYVMLTGNWSYW